MRIDRPASENSSARYFVDAGKYVLAETKALPPHMTAQAEANARLIAAAPDLLDTCKELKVALAAAMRVVADLDAMKQMGIIYLTPVHSGLRFRRTDEPFVVAD